MFLWVSLHRGNDRVIELFREWRMFFHCRPRVWRPGVSGPSVSRPGIIMSRPGVSRPGVSGRGVSGRGGCGDPKLRPKLTRYPRPIFANSKEDTVVFC